MVEWLSSEPERAALIESVLRALPEWFGIEASTQEYIREGSKMPCCAVLSDGKAVGFACLRQCSSAAAEIYVIGVLPQYHHRHLGTELMYALEKKAIAEGMRLLQVKTLSPEKKDPGYLKTYAFYCAKGFYPLEVLPLWGENNPCLVLVKPL